MSSPHLISVIPALMTFAVIPMAAPATLSSGQIMNFQVATLNVGILYIFAVAILGVYGIIMAGWASNNKYALLGSSTQLVANDQLRALDGSFDHRHRHDFPARSS